MILEIEQVIAQLFFVELIGRQSIECRQLPHGTQVRFLSASAEAAQLKIVCHALAQAEL